jgi:ABC-type phosphate transport system substrate-binding protein
MVAGPMSTIQKEAGFMLKTLRQRRRGFVGLGAAVGTTAMVLSMAVPAGAASTTSPAQNDVLLSGGSNTTYTMMQQLSDLFNSAPGCDLVGTNGTDPTQNLDYSCPTSPAVAAPGGENGYALSYPSENPYNDVVADEPALGSGNGIAELEYQGGPGGSDLPSPAAPATPPNVAPLSFARSSRAANTTLTTGDKEGLNFVAYAEDAVPWFHYAKYDKKKTASAGVTTLTTTQLTSIYEGNTTNWSAVGGTSAPIYVFIAQSGSGTESTWATDLGLSGKYPYGGVNGAGSEDAATGCPVTDFEIFENEDASIVNTPCTKVNPADAIFFFSYGKYTLLCPKGVCPSTPPAPKKTTAALGEIGGIAASKTTIQNGAFALDRSLYNVYSDGTNTNLPAESQDVENFVSTYGFLCKPQTATEVDPLSPTGETYRTEIENIIEANGFFPIPEGSEGDDATGITTPDFTDPNYAAGDPAPPTVGSTPDDGYCQVTTTDGDGNS